MKQLIVIHNKNYSSMNASNCIWQIRGFCVIVLGVGDCIEPGHMQHPSKDGNLMGILVGISSLEIY